MVNFILNSNMQALGYQNFQWVNKSFLSFIHGKDIENVIQCFKNGVVFVISFD